MKTRFSFALWLGLGMTLAAHATTVLAPGEVKDVKGEQVVCSLGNGTPAPAPSGCSVGPSMVCDRLFLRRDPGCSVSCPSGQTADCQRAGCIEGYKAYASSCTCK